MTIFKRILLWLMLSCIAWMHAQAQTSQQEPGLDAGLNETVVRVPKKSGFLTNLFQIELETTIFKPDGEGPFPIVVINHGKDGTTLPQLQPRYRPLHAVRYFLHRGYAVFVPMRQGFAHSGGSYVSGGCNLESNGRSQADDVETTLQYATVQPWTDKHQIVIVGQSHGGWTTLAFGTRNDPNVKGLINFAGGLKVEKCAGWQGALVRAASDYGAETKIPSLWLYGDNDRYWPTEIWRDMYQRYTAGGAPAQLAAYGVFQNDSHRMFYSANGKPIWQPLVTKFLADIGMPSEPLAQYDKFEP